MCGSGGGGTQTVVQQQQVPQFVQDYFNWQSGQQQNLFGQAQTLYNQNVPYVPYNAQRIQPLTSDQLTGMEGMRNNAGFQSDPTTGQLSSTGQAPLGQPQLQTAVDRNTAGSQTYGGAGGQPFQPGAVQTQDFNAPGVAASYMSPYIGNVANTAMDELNRQQNISQQGIDDQATTAGAFGGDRQAVADAMNTRNYGQIKANTLSNLLNTGYGQAQAGFGADQARSLQAQSQNQNMGLQAFGANANQFNTDQNRLLQSSQLAANQGLQAQGMGAFDTGQMMNAGNIGQQQGQNYLNQSYQDFLNQKSYPYMNLGFLESAMRAQPFSPMGGTTTSQVPTQGYLQQAAGLGLTGAAIGSMTGLWGGR